MPVLARKIARAKWEQKSELGDGEIGADAITSDLKTTGNALSFWRCESPSSTDISRAVLALAVVAERPDRLEFVCLDEDAVQSKGLKVTNTPADTPCPSIRDYHVDVGSLDLLRLGLVAEMVATAHRSESSRTITKKEVLKIVAQSVREGLMEVHDLKGKMRDAVQNELRHGIG